MFSQASVILSTGRAYVTKGGIHGEGGTCMVKERSCKVRVGMCGEGWVCTVKRGMHGKEAMCGGRHA